MIPLYTNQEFSNTKSQNKLPLKCTRCGETFYLRKASVIQIISGYHPTRGQFCSKKCFYEYKSRNKEVIFEQGGKIFVKKHRYIKKTNHNFCSHSYSCKFTASHKTTGTRRSKFEM